MYYEKAWHSEPNDLKNSETARNLANRQIVDINKVLSSLGSNLLLDEYANIKEESCSIKRKRV